MTIHDDTPRALDVTQVPAHKVGGITAALGAVKSSAAAKWLAVLRLATGFIFLWAFFDKTFGWGYATPSERAWVNGGSPTKGFLSNVDVGPFAETFRSWAGDAWADWLFMAALLGVGVALVAGVALRIAAASGGILMLLMWAAEWPLAKVNESGEPTMSTNPLVDSHIIYAIVLIVLALTYAGRTWGLGKVWEQIPIVHRNRWLL
jgi:thiosulfate dehydrogenase [quinone] large subunit